MKPKSAIAKGKELEDFIVSRLHSTGLDTRAYRQRGSGNGMNKGDVWNDLGLCFEAKNTKNFSPKAIRQAERESLGTQEPVVVWHRPQTPLEDSVVMIKWPYFETLLQRAKQPITKEPDRVFAYKLNRLISAAKDLLKELNV